MQCFFFQIEKITTLAAQSFETSRAGHAPCQRQSFQNISSHGNRQFEGIIKRQKIILGLPDSIVLTVERIGQVVCIILYIRKKIQQSCALNSARITGDPGFDPPPLLSWPTLLDIYNKNHLTSTSNHLNQTSFWVYVQPDPLPPHLIWYNSSTGNELNRERARKTAIYYRVSWSNLEVHITKRTRLKVNDASIWTGFFAHEQWVFITIYRTISISHSNCTDINMSRGTKSSEYIAIDRWRIKLIAAAAWRLNARSSAECRPDSHIHNLKIGGWGLLELVFAPRDPLDRTGLIRSAPASHLLSVCIAGLRKFPHEAFR